MIQKRYEQARKQFACAGVDTEAALTSLAQLPISLHCWQGDDVGGFDQKGPLTGGIQATGNYPGKAQSPQQLMQDIEQVLALVPGWHKLNLHASYAIFPDGTWADRDELKPEHFAPWVAFAKQHGLGLDFNPTFFSHPKAECATLSSNEEDVRRFWVNHAKCCVRIGEYFAEQTGQSCLLNIWISDGYKKPPADRLAPRKRFYQSLCEILDMPYDRKKVLVSLESKVFGIGLESYTVGSSEFCLGFAKEKHILPLLDNGHYHPTEAVADKISSLLLFHDQLDLHMTHPVRWDSDHVVLLDEETRAIAREIVACKALFRVKVGLDFFDASLNRVCAWVLGTRNVQKAFLEALLTPQDRLCALQNEGRLTELLVWQEELKGYPYGAVYDEFCCRSGVPVSQEWLAQALIYENSVLKQREGQR